MVPVLSIVFIGFSIVFSMAIPVGLAIYYKKKYHASLRVFLAGCIIFMVFAMLLESLFHTVVLTSPIGGVIRNSTWLYALYGGLAAGVFEECGRLVAMKYFLKNQHDNIHNSLMYGAGHGGCEAVLILGIGMINYFLYALLINAGQQDVLLNPITDTAQKEALQNVFTNMIESNPVTFLFGDIERVSAVILHIALSVLVWLAVVYGKKMLFPLAIFLHFLVDFLSVVIGRIFLGSIGGMVVTEAIILVMSLAAAYVARRAWLQNKSSCEEQLPVE